MSRPNWFTERKRLVSIFKWTCPFFLILLIAMPCWSEIIPLDRRINWNPGIPGGIPNRTTIFANVRNSPYYAVGDGVANDTSAIQQAINDCPEGQVVYLPAGIYNITSGLSISKGIVLRGDGPENTVIRMTNSRPLHIITISSGSIGGQVLLTGGYTKDSTTLTIDTSDSDESLFAVGRYIIVGQSDTGNPLVVRGDATWDKMRNDYDNDLVSLAQIVRITGRNGSTITISPGLYLQKESQYHPFIASLSSVVTNAGIEDMKIERTASDRFQGSIITFKSCVYSWIRNVETVKVSGRHIRLIRSFGCEVRDSYWHEAWAYGSGGTAYGLSINLYSSANLITNNIGMYLNNGVQTETTGGGNVISYNYLDGFWTDDSNPNWQAKAIGSHASHPYMDLVEGNQMTQFRLDSIHGSASHYTVFRNYIDTDHTFPTHPDHSENDTDMTVGVRLDSGYYTNVVGNIIGQPSYPHSPTTERYESTSYSECVTYQNQRHMYAFRTNDTKVYNTTYRHGNYDYATNSTIWDIGNPDHDLPDSLYLTEKPSWFGSSNWPPFGPDTDFENNKIPAQIRFEQIMLGITIPTAPTGLRITQ